MSLKIKESFILLKKNYINFRIEKINKTFYLIEINHIYKINSHNILIILKVIIIKYYINKNLPVSSE